MPFPDFFNQFGIQSAYEFLSADFCDELAAQMIGGIATAGAIWNSNAGDHVQENFKKRKEIINLPNEAQLHIREKLLEIMPRFEAEFGVELKDVQPIKFTRYDTGDYYRQHIDISPDKNAPPIVNSRKVSVIIFVNQEGEDLTEGDYCGGNLTFYGLLDDPQWRGIGLPLESEAGLLIAFRPNILHEVTPVTDGRRLTITTWYE